MWVFRVSAVVDCKDRYRYAQVYCGLSTEEVLWLVSRHNITAAMHHYVISS